MVEETFEPGMTVSLVARRHGVAPNQLFTWRRLVAQGGLTAAGSGDRVASVITRRVFSSAISVLGKSTTIRSGVGFSADIGHLRCGIVFFLGPGLPSRLLLRDRDRSGMTTGALRLLSGDLCQEAAELQ